MGRYVRTLLFAAMTGFFAMIFGLTAVAEENYYLMTGCAATIIIAVFFMLISLRNIRRFERAQAVGLHDEVRLSRWRYVSEHRQDVLPRLAFLMQQLEEDSGFRGRLYTAARKDSMDTTAVRDAVDALLTRLTGVRAQLEQGMRKDPSMSDRGEREYIAFVTVLERPNDFEQIAEVLARLEDVFVIRCLHLLGFADELVRDNNARLGELHGFKADVLSQPFAEAADN
jgi:hypothetical protein